MILVAGGSGRLGRAVVDLLLARGLPVRVLTRDPDRTRTVADSRVEIVAGDVRDIAAVRRAVDGAGVVVSAIQGFAGSKGVTPATVDRDGNRNLIQASAEARVEHFVLTSVKDAGARHSMELMRMKHAAEQALQASGVPWTVIRPTAYMETWCEVLCRPLLEKGRTRVFGNGRNPINWVSVFDVAQFIDGAVGERTMLGEVLEVGGPQDLSMLEFVDVFQRGTGVSGTVGRMPPLVMRLTAMAMTPVLPAIARQIRAGIVMDTEPMAFDASAVRSRYPSIPNTALIDVVHRDYGEARGEGDPASAAPVS